MTEPDEGAATAVGNAPRRRSRLQPVLSFAVVIFFMWISTVVVGLVAGDPSPSRPLTVVQVLVGSESKPLLADPKMVAAFARHGFKLVVEDEGSRQMATDAQT